MPSISYIPSNTWSPTDGFGYKIARKEVTFLNTAAGNQDLFTVTGDVIVRVVGVVGTSLTSAAAGNVAVGCVGETDIIGGYTIATTLDAREIWHDMTPDSEIEDLSTMREAIITDGNNITLYYDAQIDAGVLVFYCFWTPLSAGSSVVAV